MYNPFGLQGWEIVLVSGIYAMCAVAFASVIGFTLAWLMLRERSVVRHPVVVAPSETRQPEIVATAPSVA